jgi:hypothetical protein
MKMTLESELAREVKAPVALTFRNGPIEELQLVFHSSLSTFRIHMPRTSASTTMEWGWKLASCWRNTRSIIGSRVEWILGLDIDAAGPMVQSRITGSFQGIRNKLPELPVESFVRMDGRGMRDKSYRLIGEFLNRHPKDRHILIAAATDTSALGALEAVKELRRERHVAIAGQDCIPEAIEEMRKHGSPWIGSASYEVANAHSTGTCYSARPNSPSIQLR